LCSRLATSYSTGAHLRLGVTSPDDVASTVPAPEPSKPIALNEEQEREVAAGFVAAQLSLLEAIAREAKSESFEASRNVTRLTHALNGLRFAAGQVPGSHMPFPPFFGFPPGEEMET